MDEHFETNIIKFKTEVAEQPEVYSGKSPFIFRQGMNVVRDGDAKNVSVDYIKNCCKSGRINEFDILVLELVYKYRYLNRRMILTATGKPEQALKKLLHKLVSNGFLYRYYCTYPSGTETMSTPFFYGVSKGVFDYFGKTWDKGAFIVPEPLTAMKVLACNQFIISSREYRPDMVDEKFDIKFDVNKYIYRYPYSSTYTVKGNSVTFVPIVIRREDKDKEVAVTSVKIMLGLIKKFGEGAAPVLVCEDVLHMAAMYEAIASDDKTAGLVIYYTYDLAIPGGRMFDRIYICKGTTADGKPAFAERMFDFDSL